MEFDRYFQNNIQLFILRLKILHYADVFYHHLAKIMSLSQSDNAIMTIGEVADYLKVTERTIYRLAGAKKIPSFKVGGSWRFSKVDIDTWIHQQSVVDFNSVESRRK